jgi:hypothetical protein
MHEEGVSSQPSGQELRARTTSLSDLPLAEGSYFTKPRSMVWSVLEEVIWEA